MSHVTGTCNDTSKEQPYEGFHSPNQASFLKLHQATYHLENMLFSLVLVVLGARGVDAFTAPISKGERLYAPRQMNMVSVELARGLAAGAAGLEIAALTMAVPMAVKAASAKSKHEAHIAQGQIDAREAIAERKRLRKERAETQAAEQVKKADAKAKLAERIAAAKAEELRLEQNQAAVLKAEQERAAKKKAEMMAKKQAV